MHQASPSPDQPWSPVDASRLRELVSAHDPDYAAGLAEADWQAGAEGLSALARLLWRISAEAVPPAAGPEPQPRTHHRP